MAEETAPISPPKQIKFGILGCAKIACKISRAISLVPNATLQAISSRSPEKATKFISENGLDSTVKIYGSYEALLDDPYVDAVYIPLPTTLHVRWAVESAEKKKHILLEKPAALNVVELDQILEACERNGVQFMDASMWVHHPRTAKMKEFLSDEKCFGELKLIQCCLSYNAGPEFLKNDIRVKPDLDALGALGDLGWYCTKAILWAVDYELPKTVVALRGAIHNEAGVILSCGSSLHWEDGKMATFYCSFLSYLTFDVTAIGTKGSLRLHDILLPFHEESASFYAASECNSITADSGWAPQTNEHNVATDVPQEVLMVKKFASLVESVKSNCSEPERVWSVLCKKNQLVLDAVKASLERDFEPVEIDCQT